jgi:formyltetrahydrofolate hydrolase
MAEIFAAVASGAGLVSLAIQLLESSQKLKGFCNTCKDAPQTVADLSFELETMSLSLRQLDNHRRADVLDDQLLSRCVMSCTRMNTKIEAAVAKMDGLLKKFRGVGRVYTAFKEPEMQKLLEQLEHAKSSMLFAYMSYCQ